MTGAPFAFAFGVSAAALAAALFLAVGIAALRGLRRWRAARQAAREPAWREALRVAIEDPARARLPPIAPPELAAFLALWGRAHRAVEGAAAENLAALLRLQRLDERVLRLLARPSPRLKLLAVSTLGALREPRAWDRLADLTMRRDPVLSFSAAHALLRIDARRALHLLAPAMCARRDWPLGRLGGILQAIGPHVVTEPLVGMLASGQRQGLDRAVRLARFGHRAHIAPLMRGALGTGTEPEAIVAALEYAAEAEDLPWAHAAAQHAEWPVRAASAGALARAGGRAAMPVLLALLRDPVWRVRYRASQALIRLEGLTAMELDALRDSERDAYAADMLAQALAEANLR